MKSPRTTLSSHRASTLVPFEDCLKLRTFLFLHHFCGRHGNLSRAVEEECIKIGVKVETISTDIERGQGLLADEPYKSHKRAAEEGLVDGYHCGFPRTTFTRLRWSSPNMPGPVKSKTSPYAFRDLTEKEKLEKLECDAGTVMMPRSAV